jgi:hypothetical protein
MLTLFEMFLCTVCHNNMIHFEIQFDNGKHYVGKKKGGGVMNIICTEHRTKTYSASSVTAMW